MDQYLIDEALEETKKRYLIGKEKDFEGAYIFLTSILQRPGKITEKSKKWADSKLRALYSIY